MTNKLKLLLLSIMGIGLGLSFCSADYNITITGDSFGCYTGDYENNQNINITYNVEGYILYSRIPYYNFRNDLSSFFGNSEFLSFGKYENNTFDQQIGNYYDYAYFCYRFYTDVNDFIDFYNSQGGSSSSDIDVFYNNGNSTETITCDGVQAIQINGLSSLTSINTFTPYYNISYIDEDNQKLTESYSKDILYLENGQFKKTYTGNNDWILSVQGNSENSFSGYLPTFEITGGIEEVSESGNIFNNFAENSLKFTLSNIPSYIQYVILLFILFFILGFIRKFRRK